VETDWFEDRPNKQALPALLSHCCLACWQASGVVVRPQCTHPGASMHPCLGDFHTLFGCIYKGLFHAEPWWTVNKREDAAQLMGGWDDD
jgi:hypothetical protein